MDCDGVGLGAGGLGGGVSVGFGVGLADVAPGAGALGEFCGLCPAAEEELAPAVAEPDFFPWPPDDGVAEGLAPDEALEPGLAPGVVAGGADVVVVVDAAEVLKRFMKPKTPTVLSNVARQVSLDSLRRPSSRCAVSRSRYRMSAKKPETTLRDHQELLKSGLNNPGQQTADRLAARWVG